MKIIKSLLTVSVGAIPCLLLLTLNVAFAGDADKEVPFYRDIASDDARKSFETSKKLLAQQRELHQFLMDQVRDGLKKKTIVMNEKTSPEDKRIANGAQGSIWLLGELRVTDSASLLVEALEFDVHYPAGNLNELHPAESALVKIGPSSAPPLMQALETTRDFPDNWKSFDKAVRYLRILRRIVGDAELRRMIGHWKEKPETKAHYQLCVDLLETKLSWWADRDNLNRVSEKYYGEAMRKLNESHREPQPKK